MSKAWVALEKNSASSTCNWGTSACNGALHWTAPASEPFFTFPWMQFVSAETNETINGAVAYYLDWDAHDFRLRLASGTQDIPFLCMKSSK